MAERLPEMLSNKKCGQCLFSKPCLICGGDMFVHKDIFKPEPVYRNRIDPKYRASRRKNDTRGENVNFAKRLGGEPDLLNDDSESKRKLSACPQLQKHFEKGLPSITSNQSEQMENKEATKDYYRSS